MAKVLRDEMDGGTEERTDLWKLEMRIRPYCKNGRIVRLFLQWGTGE